MFAKDKRKLDALRAIKAELLLLKTGKDVTSGEIPETLEIKLLQKLVKQRKEAAIIYKEQNRPDLEEDELYQTVIIEAYLPAQLTTQEVEELVALIIKETRANSIKDMGKVMGAASARLEGKADNKTISGIVKKLLS